MKTKKISQKLVLNKKTVATLDDGIMNNVRGRALEPGTAGCPNTENPYQCTECCATAGSCSPACLTSANPFRTCLTQDSWCI